jgi:hypothetical protein
MNKQISFLLFIIWFTINAFSQDSEFKWSINASMGGCSYTVKIEKKDTNCRIQINLPKSDDSICSKISKTDCDSLMTFLSNYSFKYKGSSIVLETRKEYQNTKLLNDSNWILLNGDSIRLSGARRTGLMFDKDTKKYYYESDKMVNITDGTDYRGKFVTNTQTKEFDIHSGRISEEDYKLNQIIGNLIKKYFSTQDYSILLNHNANNKPVRKEYQ